MFQQIAAQPSLTWRAFFTLSLVIGQRKTELLEARWADIDLQTGVWKIPDTKSSRSHTVPLVTEACKILMDGWFDELIFGWMIGWMDGRLVGWMDGWMYGWMNGWIHGRMVGWMG